MDKMKLMFCSYSRIPSATANSLAVMKMGESLSKISDLTLVAFRGDKFYCNEGVESYYGVSNFRKILLPKQFHIFKDSLFAIMVLVLAKITNPKICYSRDIRAANYLASAGFPVFYEIHQIEQDNINFNVFFQKELNKLLLNKNIKKLICISEELKKECIEFGFSEDRIAVLPSGVDKNFSKNKITKICAKKKLNLGLNKPTIVYVGSLQCGKGIEMIIKLCFAKQDYQFVIVGGKREELANYVTSVPSNLLYYPQVSPKEVIRYLSAADILIMPFSKNTKLKFHSPLKLFEYFAMGKPIVASNTWSISEIITDGVNGLLAEPDNLENFIKKIDRLVGDNKLRKRLSVEGRKTANRYTWGKRAQKLINLVEEVIG